ncbi:unnamed protein product [Absidia cylindrospora]
MNFHMVYISVVIGLLVAQCSQARPIVGDVADNVEGMVATAERLTGIGKRQSDSIGVTGLGEQLKRQLV